MAEASASPFDIKDLTQCGICLLELQNPKALPCLHSFCLKCLSQWAKGKSSVTCPLCVQEFEIPSGGVNSFRTNFFINTLKERSENLTTITSKDAVRPCASCEISESKIEGHCKNCKGFICGDCVDIHAKIKNLRDHKIIPYADLQSGKVNIQDIHQKRHCKIHEDQVLKFYCETCGELICLECTVINHAATSHSLVSLESATKVQKTEIEQLKNNCDDVKKKMDGSLEELEKLSETLTKNVAKAGEDIDEAFQNAVKMLENKRIKLKDELKTVEAERKKQINAEKDAIHVEQTRLIIALQMATEVLQTGTDYDLVQVYASLKSNLTILCKLKPNRISKSLGDVSFKRTPTSKQIVYNLGSIASFSQGARKINGEWKMRKSFGHTGDAKLNMGTDVAISQQNEIMVSDFQGNSIKFYEMNGTLKSTTKITNPWNIKISQDGHVFVSNCTTLVSVYDKQMNLTKQFPIRSPDGALSDRQRTDVRGLAFDNHKMLLVGECNQKYVSKHRLDGTHVMSFKVAIKPYYISVSSHDKVILSSLNAALVLDEQGNHLHSFKPPSGISTWSPWGVCCISDDEVYIANCASPGISLWLPWGVCCTSDDEVNISHCTSPGSIDIYSTESGGYMGCLTKDVTNPKGLILNDSEDKLFVVEDKRVKIFELE